MGSKQNRQTNYLYTYNCYEEERSLCALEMRSLFGSEPQASMVESQVATIQVTGETFKVIYVKNGSTSKTEKVEFENRRAIEKEIGLQINGTADIHQPQRLFGVMAVNGRWIFGDYVKSESIWFRHQQKPHSYSTALNTRVARAVVNIAIPNPSGIKAIDPCCGIGTVLVEALSMGIDIVGSDKNPLILGGVRENIAYFGLNGEVKLKDIRDITNHYDVAIIDLPYNLCSVITPEEQTEMLQSARRFARKVVVVTVESIDEVLINVGFVIIDRAVVKKGSFTREVIVCK